LSPSIDHGVKVGFKYSIGAVFVSVLID